MFCLFTAAYQPFVSDFIQRYLSTPDHNPLTTTLGTNAATPRTGPAPLLREWAKAALASLTPQFAESRMTLSCVAFRLPMFAAHRRGYRVDTAPFVPLEIRTRHNRSQLRSLYLVHPWLDALLDHEDAEGDGMPLLSPYPDDDEILDEESDNDDEDDEGGTDEDR